MKKRLICAVLSLVMLLSMAVTARADDTAALQQMMKDSFNQEKMLDIRDYEKGFEAMNSGKCGKVILDWTSL